MKRRRVLGGLGLLLSTMPGCLTEASENPPRAPRNPADERVPVTEKRAGKWHAGDRAGSGPASTVGIPHSVSVTTFDFAEGPDGRILLNLTLENEGLQNRSVDVTAAVEVANETRDLQKRVRVKPGERRSIAMAFEGNWSEFTPNLEYVDVAVADG